MPLEVKKEISLEGHTDTVNSCAWSPDSSKVLTASDDKTARIWDAASHQILEGQTLFTLEGHTDLVMGCAWSPDGSKVLTASYDMTARLWDAATGQTLFILKGHSDTVMGCAWSPDGSKVLTGSRDKTARVWDAVLAVLRTSPTLIVDTANVGFSLDSPPPTDTSNHQTTPTEMKLLTPWVIPPLRLVRLPTGNTDVLPLVGTIAFTVQIQVVALQHGVRLSFHFLDLLPCSRCFSVDLLSVLF